MCPWVSVHPVPSEGHTGQLVGQDVTVLWKIYSSRPGKRSGVHCLAWVSGYYLVGTISKESYVWSGHRFVKITEMLLKNSSVLSAEC